MTMAQDPRQSSRGANPLYNGRKLKLGTFGSNLRGGCAIMTTAEGILQADWPSTLMIAKLADEMEFEAVVPVGRWRGYGGTTNFHGPSFEPYSWAAGIGGATKYPCIFVTSHVGTIHPVMAAKQGVTIDHITGGRFALNIVAGWYAAEMEMFGVPLLDHDSRYEMAAEWIEIVRRLWTEEREFDYDGRYYQIKKGYMQPKPLQKPFPVLMNAGGSEKGRHYAARYCDLAFVALGTDDPSGAASKIRSYRELARKDYARDINIWSYAYVVQADTQREAEQYFDYCVNRCGDWEAAKNLAGILGMNERTMSPDDLSAAMAHLIAGWGGYPLIGTKEAIVEGLLKLSRMGLDGVLLSWPRYIDDMRRFQQETLPLLKQSGLR